MAENEVYCSPYSSPFNTYIYEFYIMSYTYTIWRDQFYKSIFWQIEESVCFHTFHCIFSNVSYTSIYKWFSTFACWNMKFGLLSSYYRVNSLGSPLIGRYILETIRFKENKWRTSTNFPMILKKINSTFFKNGDVQWLILLIL